MSENEKLDLYKMGEKFIPKNYDPVLYKIRHSVAHILAQAVRDHFAGEGQVRLAIGPPIENGFYYDFELPRSINDDELAVIEERMKSIIRGEHEFFIREIQVEEALELFKEQPYKLELIEGLAKGNLDENGNVAVEKAPITVYQHDDFVDLCRGPHVANTKDINPEAIKLLNVSGAYWRGDSEKPMLQRIYGTAWETKEQLDHYLWQLEEAEKRDHRRLGRELELFYFDATAPGMPYWLPKGLRVLNELISFWREEHEKYGYQEVSTPLINEKSLWETSGHWEHYKDNMFVIPVSEHVTYGVKPMNCPNAMVVYNLKTRSYRDLPLRISDSDVLHRREASGSLHGLLRTQKFQQDDAHIFITEDQLGEEFESIFDLADRFYGIFGLNYKLRLGTRPDSYIGDLETWNKAEQTLKHILDQRVGQGNYLIEEGDGAFYGPKIDILMEDVLGRQWQMGTMQLDFQLPRRFNCSYVDRDGSKKTPIVIHRVIYGSLERFIGILIEHTGGAFPVWLAPVQVNVIPITDAHQSYAEKVVQQLREAGLRVELIGEEMGRLNARIREGQLKKVPYMLVIGNREMEGESVSVRMRSNENLGSMGVNEFISLAQSAIKEKRQD
jgi:threonyl-tRNA synthetase